MAAARDDLEIEKLKVEVNKIIAETAKINQERSWYPFVLLTAALVAGAALAKAVL